MSIQWRLIPLCLVWLLIALAACGGGAPATDPSGSSTDNAQPTDSQSGSGEAVTIRWWHINTQENEKEALQKLADEYTQANPHVSIEITVLENEAFKAKLATGMQSGDPPDVFQSWGGGVLKQYADAGLVQNLTEALSREGWGASIAAGPASLYTFDGQSYGVPWRAGMVGFWYNKDLFKQAGIEQVPQTWSDFLDTVSTLKEAGITPIALGEKEKWPGHFYWVYLAIRMGGQPAFEAAYNRSGSFADTPFVAAGERLKELIDLQPFQEGFLGADYATHATMMANGQAAMELMGQWAPGYERSLAEDVDRYNRNLGFFPFPTVSGGAGDPSDVLGGGDGFAVGKNAPPEAIEFVRFMTSLEIQQKLAAAGIAAPPVVKGAENSLEDPLFKDLQQRVAEAKYFQLYYDQYLPPAVGVTVNDSIQALFAGAATPEEVARMIEESAAAELRE